MVEEETAFKEDSRTPNEQSSVVRGRTRTLTPSVKDEAKRDVGMEQEWLEIFKSSQSVVSFFIPPEIGISKL